MIINRINFATSFLGRKHNSDPYPISGGKVEKFQYEVEHGMRPCSDRFESTHSSFGEPGATDCPGSISDLFPDGCYEHNPWFPLDD